MEPANSNSNRLDLCFMPTWISLNLIVSLGLWFWHSFSYFIFCCFVNFTVTLLTAERGVTKKNNSCQSPQYSYSFWFVPRQDSLELLVLVVIFLFPSSRASRSCRAPREISRSPRLAHKAPVMQTFQSLFSWQQCLFVFILLCLGFSLYAISLKSAFMKCEAFKKTLNSRSFSFHNSKLGSPMICVIRRIQNPLPTGFVPLTAQCVALLFLQLQHRHFASSDKSSW